jgi:predicted Zn-dependent protease
LGAAGALIALNRLDEAKAHVERAEKLAGDHPWVRLRKAQLAWRAGDRGGYDEMRRIAAEHPDSIEVWRDIKDAARKFGDKSAAKEAATQLARLQRGEREPNPAP